MTKNNNNLYEELKDWQDYQLVAAEALLKRASLLNEPFMLKGSLITRQYFKKIEERDIADMDWVYLKKISDIDTASQTFSNWITKITTIDYDDDIKFRDFRENKFWRRIDYAMADDFPTVNTDILFQIGDFTDEISLDISFNLDMEIEPVPLLYYPMFGKPFSIPYTPPLSLQIAWKLHQTIVRPRYKDLKDLMQLFSHSSYNENIFQDIIKSLLSEWKRDNYINPKQMKDLFYGALYSYKFYEQIERDYDWRMMSNHSRENFNKFVNEFVKVLRKAGFNEKVYQNLSIPEKARR